MGHLAAEPRAGRPRDPACDHAIVDATVELLIELGYERLTIEGVAARSGVSKATIYRRYPNKAELVVDALGRRTGTDEPLTDTGDVRADVRALLQRFRDKLAGVDGSLMAIFAAARLTHPELAEIFERSVVAPRQAHVRTMLQRAVDRGDLPANTDIPVVAEAGPAILWYRHTLRKERIEADLPARIVAQLLPEQHG